MCDEHRFSSLSYVPYVHTVFCELAEIADFVRPIYKNTSNFTKVTVMAKKKL